MKIAKKYDVVKTYWTQATLDTCHPAAKQLIKQLMIISLCSVLTKIKERKDENEV